MYRTSPTPGFVAACAAVLLSVGVQMPSARAAVVVSAQGGVTAGAAAQVPQIVTSPPDAGPADIFPSISDAGSFSFGHVYSYADGTIGSRSSGTGTYSAYGSATYHNSYTAPTTGDYYFKYTITAGELGVHLDADANGTQSASTSAVVTLTTGSGTTTLLNYAASMNLASNNTLPTFLESGPVLNTLGATLSLGDGTYAWGDYAASVFLGSFAAGQTFDLDYVLSSSANGTTQMPIFIATNIACAADITAVVQDVPGCGPFGGSGSAIARFGDPDGPYLVAPSVFGIETTAVPEPASIGAFMAGAAGLAAVRRRRRR